jgi:transcriptional regulator with XRE-family HTH domain
MNAGTQYIKIPQDRLFDDYYTNLHGAYNAMQSAFQMRAEAGLTQDNIATMLDIDKGLVSKRLNGTENLTLRTLSYMGTAMCCRVTIVFTPYESVGNGNYYKPTESVNGTIIGDVSIGSTFFLTESVNAKLEPIDG